MKGGRHIIGSSLSFTMFTSSLMLLIMFTLACPATAAVCEDQLNPQSRAVLFSGKPLSAMQPKSVGAFFCAPGNFTLHVWRPVPQVEDQYRALYKVYMESDAMGTVTVNLSPDEDIEDGDFLGVLAGSPGALPISVMFTSDVVKSGVFFSEDVLTVINVGDIVMFGDLPFPFEPRISICPENDCANDIWIRPFATTTATTVITTGSTSIDCSSMSSPPDTCLTSTLTTPTVSWPTVKGAKGDKGDLGMMGEQGETGDTGWSGLTGEDGAMGPQGGQGPPGGNGADNPSVGSPGAKGEVGWTGEQGDPGELVDEDGTPIVGTLTGSECDCSGLMNEYVVLGVIIWAVILTLVTIVMIVMATNVTGARRI